MLQKAISLNLACRETFHEVDLLDISDCFLVYKMLPLWTVNIFILSPGNVSTINMN